ncbi:MAG: hypothetical protein NXI12_14415 [Alphaproteobacteria bacterium]|nr:hypothetical protein [Alphaproteobacteria bacterium]
MAVNQSDLRDLIELARQEGRKSARAMKDSFAAGLDYGLTKRERVENELDLQQDTLRHGIILRDFATFRGCSDEQASQVLQAFGAAIWAAYGYRSETSAHRRGET